MHPNESLQLWYALETPEDTDSVYDHYFSIHEYDLVSCFMYHMSWRHGTELDAAMILTITFPEILHCFRSLMRKYINLRMNSARRDEAYP